MCGMKMYETHVMFLKIDEPIINQLEFLKLRNNGSQKTFWKMYRGTKNWLSRLRFSRPQQIPGTKSAHSLRSSGEKIDNIVKRCAHQVGNVVERYIYIWIWTYWWMELSIMDLDMRMCIYITYYITYYIYMIIYVCMDTTCKWCVISLQILQQTHGRTRLSAVFRNCLRLREMSYRSGCLEGRRNAPVSLQFIGHKGVISIFNMSCD